MSTRRRVRLLVAGRVQGVGFRRFVELRGAAHGVDGWVRNCGDGSVEIVVEGEPAQLAAFARDVRRGPPGAAVRELTEAPAPDHPPLAGGFTVRRD